MPGPEELSGRLTGKSAPSLSTAERSGTDAIQNDHGKETGVAPSLFLVVIVFLCCCALVALRSPSGLMSRNLSFEDGSVFFGFYYEGDRGFPEIFRHYSGYISLWSQFAAWFAAKFPLGVHVALYSVLSLLMTAASCVALGFSGLLHSRFLSVVFALTLAALPFNSGLYQHNLTHSQWPALLVFYGLVARLLISPPKRWPLALLAAATAILAWVLWSSRRLRVHCCDGPRGTTGGVAPRADPLLPCRLRNDV